MGLLLQNNNDPQMRIQGSLLCSAEYEVGIANQALQYNLDGVKGEDVALLPTTATGSDATK